MRGPAFPVAIPVEAGTATPDHARHLPKEGGTASLSPRERRQAAVAALAGKRVRIVKYGRNGEGSSFVGRTGTVVLDPRSPYVQVSQPDQASIPCTLDEVEVIPDLPLPGERYRRNGREFIVIHPQAWTIQTKETPPMRYDNRDGTVFVVDLADGTLWWWWWDEQIAEAVLTRVAPE